MPKWNINPSKPSASFSPLPRSERVCEREIVLLPTRRSLVTVQSASGRLSSCHRAPLWSPFSRWVGDRPLATALLSGLRLVGEWEIVLSPPRCSLVSVRRGAAAERTSHSFSCGPPRRTLLLLSTTSFLDKKQPLFIETYSTVTWGLGKLREQCVHFGSTLMNFI